MDIFYLEEHKRKARNIDCISRRSFQGTWKCIAVKELNCILFISLVSFNWAFIYIYIYIYIYISICRPYSFNEPAESYKWLLVFKNIISIILKILFL